MPLARPIPGASSFLLLLMMMMVVMMTTTTKMTTTTTTTTTTPTTPTTPTRRSRRRMMMMLVVVALNTSPRTRRLELSRYGPEPCVAPWSKSEALDAQACGWSSGGPGPSERQEIVSLTGGPVSKHGFSSLVGPQKWSVVRTPFLRHPNSKIEALCNLSTLLMRCTHLVSLAWGC